MAPQPAAASASAEPAAAKRQKVDDAPPHVESVRQALTLRGAQLCWAILNGHKRIENRSFPLRGWYLLHCGKGAPQFQLEECAAAGAPQEAALDYKGKIVGAFHVCCTLPYDRCRHDKWAIESFGACNVIDAVVTLPRPVACSGQMKAWEVPADALRQIRDQLRGAAVRRVDVSDLVTQMLLNQLCRAS